MALPMIVGAGRLTAEPELRYSQGGMAICTFTVAFNNRIKDGDEWKDGVATFLKAVLFKDKAEAFAEKATKGTEVTITGRLETQKWEDKEGGKRESFQVKVDSVGIVAKEAVTRTKTDDWDQQSQADPWTSEPPF